MAFAELEIPQPYTALAHTADAGVEVYGADAADTLARLVLALAQSLTADAGIEATTTRELVVEGGTDLSVIAIDALRAVHALWALEGLVPAAVGVLDLDEARGARLRLRLGPFDLERHGEGLDIKAVTYHAMHFAEAAAGGFIARAIFDI